MDSKDLGLPEKNGYLERALPVYLKNSLDEMIACWERLDRGEADNHWDLYWCDLNADINCAEVDHEITSTQAWYLRERYLRMVREDI